MEAMRVLYIAFMFITLLVMGIVYALGKKRFGSSGAYLTSLRARFKDYMRIISILGLVSLLLINSGLIPPNFISFLCVPFFVVNTGVFGTYFRLRARWNIDNGKR